jgi:hypothetical protein
MNQQTFEQQESTQNAVRPLARLWGETFPMEDENESKKIYMTAYSGLTSYHPDGDPDALG